MFLRSLTLKGFKSFAEPTTLEFEPGMTVVVGPNGSGKSNIVDAVAWVLGAQGPRSMRSSRMDDVVFAGSAKRPALGRAEVSLTIDNSAGLLPVELSEVTITRTLFRDSGESEYAINRVPCRLLDVQELLSDAGVGRHQHVIVGQGQLEGVLDVRPEARRLIVEEAAGVLKYRRRREKAVRRLEAGEANLVRLTDLLREVRRQLQPLRRQAEAARRHADLAGDARALRLHLAGRELARLRRRAEESAVARAGLEAEEAALRRHLIDLDDEVAAAEAQASGPEGGGTGITIGRLEALRERGRGLAAVLAERRRSIEAERAAASDEEQAAPLEAQLAGLEAELADADRSLAGLAGDLEEVDRQEAELAREQADFRERWGDEPKVGAGQLRGELRAVTEGMDRTRREMAACEERLAALAERGGELAAEAAARDSEVEELEAAGAAGEAEVHQARSRRLEAEAERAAAETELRAALAEHLGWTARVQALGQVLDERTGEPAGAAGGAVPGVIGSLVELVDVEPGWEAAFEAAAAEGISALVAESVEGARYALARLRDEGAGATVIAPTADTRSGSLAGVPGEPVRAHVRSKDPAVERALDVLLASSVAVSGGWERALEVALAHPGVVAVTLEGDRFSATGWRVGEPGISSARARLWEAREEAEGSAVKVDEARARLAALVAAAEAAAAGEGAAQSALDQHSARLTRATESRRRAHDAHDRAAAEAEAVRAQLNALAERAEAEAATVAELRESLAALGEDDPERDAARRAARQRLEERARDLLARRSELGLGLARAEERRAGLAARLADLRERLVGVEAARAAVGARRAALEAMAVPVGRLADLLAARLAAIDGHLAEMHERRRREAERARAAVVRLDELRRRRTESEHRLEQRRAELRRAELDEAEARMRAESSVETLRRELDCEPETALEAPCPALPPGTSPQSRLRELERELRLLGPVNPLALEEFAALEERHGLLESQLDDIRRSRRELNQVIRAVDAEIVARFGAAYADVAEHFSVLFERLFPGGRGRLRLSDPDDMLDTGIEIEVRLPGKTERRLSLLSGGERSLCALAFLFAVFRARPSPFYLLDEVEAALDDVNLHRFLGLLADFRRDCQLLVVTHQKRTMEAADCLYGVTMPPGGSSRVVSERVRSAV